MIAIDNTLISDDLGEVFFICDLGRCHGACCVEGDAGAPLDEDEIGVMEDIMDKIRPFMTEAGTKVVEESGVFDYDSEGDFVTPLVNDCECAFVYMDFGVAKCAIEKAYNEGLISFKKPVSCHLYPIRITKFKDFEALNYHKWEICNRALVTGRREEVRVYEFLKEPLIRKYGKEWYAKLDQAFKEKRAIK
jgi:hypothetical protein